MHKVEALLREDFANQEILWTHRGTTALFIALQVVREKTQPGDVILPATVCPSVGLAAVYAGLRPVFCDVEPGTFCISSRTLRPHVTDRTRAVLVVHLFGKAAPLEDIETLLEGTGIALIEDCAQSLGGRYHGRKQGSFGDFSVLSFSEKKILDGNFGALLIKRAEDAGRARDIEKELPLPLADSRRIEMARSFRDLTTGAYGLLRALEFQGRLDLLIRYAEHYRSLFVARFISARSQWDRLHLAYTALEHSLTSRHDRYAAYARNLLPQVPYIRFEADEMIWRLPLILPTHEAQLRLLAMLRSNGVLASNHYFPISALFASDTAQAAKEIGLRALNLWVDAKSNLEKLPWTCDQINGAFAT